MAALGIMPGREGDPTPIRRPSGSELLRSLFEGFRRQATRGLSDQFLHEHPPYGLEGHEAAVRRARVPSKETSLERVITDSEGLAGAFRDGSLDTGLERHGCDRARGDVQQTDSSTTTDQNGLAIRRPGISGQHPHVLVATLHRDVDRIEGEPLGAGLEIEEPERRTGTELVPFVRNRPIGNVPRKRQPTSVRRYFGGKSTTARASARRCCVGSATRQINHMPRIDIHPPKLIRTAEGITVSSTFHDMVVDVSSIRGNTGPMSSWVIDDVQSSTTVTVVHPDAQPVFSVTASPDPVASNNDVLSVRCPSRRQGSGIQVLGYDARRGSVRVHQPQVVHTRSIRDERNVSAVRGYSRLVVEGDSAVLRKRARDTTRDIHTIDVP